MLFPEALNTLEQYARFVKEIPNVPILANITVKITNYIRVS